MIDKKTESVVGGMNKDQADIYKMLQGDPVKPTAQATQCVYTHKTFDICDCDCCEQRRARMAYYKQQAQASQNINPAHPLTGAVDQNATHQKFTDNMTHAQRGTLAHQMIQGEQFTAEELAEIFTRRGAYVVRGQPVLSRKGRALLEAMRDKQNAGYKGKNIDFAIVDELHDDTVNPEADRKRAEFWSSRDVNPETGEIFQIDAKRRASQNVKMANNMLRATYAVAGIALGLVLLAVFS